MKILSVIGARPQFVKEAALQSELMKLDNVQEILVHTGQHYDKNMSEIFFNVLNINLPKYNLGITANLHGEMTGKMMIELEKIMIEEKPDKVLVYGDTNSTVAAALTANKLKIEIAHIEAGLRQKKPKYMPEETNRIVTDHISDLLFCPSERSIDNLKKEGILNGVYFTGDVMYDIFLKMKPGFDYSKVDKLNLREKDYIVMTLHRDFNVDEKEKLEKILSTMNKISKEIPVIYPMHPRTKKRINEFGLNKLLDSIFVTEPIDYLQLMGLTEHCFKVVTDSGGYQKESYFSGKQAVVLMPATSWIELVEKGINCLVEPEELYNAVFKENKPDIPRNIYGNGNAAELIVKKLTES